MDWLECQLPVKLFCHDLCQGHESPSGSQRSKGQDCAHLQREGCRRIWISIMEKSQLQVFIAVPPLYRYFFFCDCCFLENWSHVVATSHTSNFCCLVYRKYVCIHVVYIYGEKAKQYYLLYSIVLWKMVVQCQIVILKYSTDHVL